jgi:hypothetical protein
MASYCLSELALSPRDGKMGDVLAVRRTGPGWLGIGLALAGIAVTVAAAFASHPVP